MKTGYIWGKSCLKWQYFQELIINHMALFFLNVCLIWVQRSNLCSYRGRRQQLLLTPPLVPLILMASYSCISLHGCWTHARMACVTAWPRRPTSGGWFILPWMWSDTEAHLPRCRRSLQPAPEGPQPYCQSPADYVIPRPPAPLQCG